MKNILQVCTLLLAFSCTAQCMEQPQPTSWNMTSLISQVDSDTLAFGAVAALALGVLIHSYYVKPPVIKPEEYPYLFQENEFRDDDEPAAPIVEKEKESSLEQYTDSDIAHWASINSNFEQPF